MTQSTSNTYCLTPMTTMSSMRMKHTKLPHFCQNLIPLTHICNNDLKHHQYLKRYIIFAHHIEHGIAIIMEYRDSVSIHIFNYHCIFSISMPYHWLIYCLVHRSLRVVKALFQIAAMSQEWVWILGPNFVKLTVTIFHNWSGQSGHVMVRPALQARVSFSYTILLMLHIYEEPFPCLHFRMRG